ncbi:peptidase M16 protein [Dinoroseobacter shibae DFL 12 = DSM 16493]|uniref:Peptidase M16 protein n=1 Tax=Dinoroseobacter shibae (strain DSM 16493 / NCIMB 14021 / DFL 12) TaxID=398580 RepID=A8LMD3_DINSH|nr:pitrilysin family protein [Dinoroseobacter shibae]ABV92110.1 peptidase M16 protein [Dinoroseobacter shibae DFL 12 = DSM 16493]URF47070.1 insulinase family protein [Dinoroseobacter shibae]URF51381.1 insulinase family protein [Dinoroseobacter shibae]
MTRWFFPRLAAAGLAVSLSVAAPAQAAEDVTTYTLDNGLEIVVIEDHRAAAVTNMVWYRTGAADEPPGKSGIAHYLEHLLFKGTDELAPGEFSATVQANGGSDNAFTSWDYTGYFQRVAADRLELMIKMEADRMVDLELSEEIVLPERDVILEERSQRVDSSPGSIFGEQRRAAQYLNHPYGVPIIGWRHEMEQLSRQDALDFYETYYAPNNAILIVAGDVQPEEVKRLAEQYFGPIPANPDLPARVRPVEPPQVAERRIAYADPRVAQPYVIRTYLAPERDSGAQETAAALTLLAELLGGSSATSFLGEKLEFEESRAVYTSAFYSGVSLDDTTFGLIVVPAEDVSLAEAEADLDRVLEQFMASEIDAEALDRIKMQVRAAEIYGRDSVDARAREYGTALTSGLTVADVQAWPKVLAAVTAEDIKAAAEMVFDKRKAVTGWLMRDGEEELMQ